MSEAKESIQNTYLPLIDNFLSGRITADDFMHRYFTTVQNDPIVSYTDEEFSIIQAIFEDCDAYDADADPSEWPLEIGEAEFRQLTQANYEKLKQLLNSQ